MGSDSLLCVECSPLSHTFLENHVILTGVLTALGRQLRVCGVLSLTISGFVFASHDISGSGGTRLRRYISSGLHTGSPPTSGKPNTQFISNSMPSPPHAHVLPYVQATWLRLVPRSVELRQRGRSDHGQIHRHQAPAHAVHILTAPRPSHRLTHQPPPT